MKRFISVLLILSSLMLCSCSGGAYDAFCSILGIDNTDYEGEDVISEITPDDGITAQLTSAACIVCYGDSIVTFDSFNDHKTEYIDIILNYLTGTFYSRYCADKDMMDKFSEQYPELSVSALIPVSDYENTVYTYFGGARKAAVSSTALYSYLDKIDAFVLLGQTPDVDVDCTVHELYETENTYRMTASFTKNNKSLGAYDFIFRKRDEGDPYIWRLQKSSKVYGI